MTNGDRGNVVNGNVTVANGNWPSGAQAVMASAGPQDGGGPQSTPIAGAQSGRCLDVPGSTTSNGTQQTAG